MLFFEGLALHVAGIRALRARPADRTRRVESVLLGAHVGGYLAAVFLVLPAAQAVAFVAVQQGLFGVYLGCRFAPNHKGMPRWAGRPSWTSCAARCSPRATSAAAVGSTWRMGGLNYQIEHHLFPSMPRPNLRQAQPLVRAYCVGHDVPYLESSLTCSYTQVLRYLHDVGAHAHPRGPVHKEEP